MSQEAPNSYQEAMTSPDKEKWLKVSTEEFKGLTEMGVWKPADHPKCRLRYVPKYDGCYKVRLVAKGYTQVQVVLPWLGLGIFNKMDIPQGGLL